MMRTRSIVPWRIRRALALAVLLPALTAPSGCAMTRYYDPRLAEASSLEQTNRAVFAFNEDFDRQVVTPVALGYVDVVPSNLRKSIGGIVYNLNEPIFAVNFLLQAEFDRSFVAMSRFALNTSVGLFGMVDYAAMIGLDQKRTSFDATLDKWSVPSGDYIVLPILGPSFPRKIVADISEGILDPLIAVPGLGETFGARAVATGALRRIEVADDLRVLREDSLDLYARMKNLYLQQHSTAASLEPMSGDAP